MSDEPLPRRRGDPLWLKFGAPLLIGILALAGWETMVTVNEVPWYILPGPVAIAKTLVRDWHMLWPSLLGTRWIELSFFPYAVILQVTPIVAIAPLIIIYIDNLTIALLVCAWIVAFFPILSNTTIGLNSADHNLLDLMRLYGAKRWQVLRYIRIPGALPFFLGGLRISGGLALIGAIVAEFVAGGAGAGSGLAFRILEASYRLEIPRMYAALFLISATGILIFLFFTALTNLLLRRWHESAIQRE